MCFRYPGGNFVLLEVAMVFKTISMFVHPSRKVSTEIKYTFEEHVSEKYLIHGFF